MGNFLGLILSYLFYGSLGLGLAACFAARFETDYFGKFHKATYVCVVTGFILLCNLP